MIPLATVHYTTTMDSGSYTINERMIAIMWKTQHLLRLQDEGDHHYLIVQTQAEIMNDLSKLINILLQERLILAQYLYNNGLLQD